MKKIKNRLYFDSWRRVNEPLFKAYITCYDKLSKNKNLNPAEELVKSLDEMGILGKVDEGDYGSAYIPSRELGIFYNDAEGNFILGENARRFIKDEITYRDYMRIYVLNYKALINDTIIRPFLIIRDYSLYKSQQKTFEDIYSDCAKYFSDEADDELAKKALGLFIGRAIEAGLIVKNRKKFQIIDELVYNLNFPETELTPEEFSERFLGGSRESHENYVKEIINTPIPNKSKTKQVKFPLNQILYGPPGTGKTYSTITKALNIIGLLEEKESYTIHEYDEAKKLFQNELGKRIEFVTMHQSFSYEDFVQGLKPLPVKSETENSTGVVFDYVPGVFKRICNRIDENKLIDDFKEVDGSFERDPRFPSFMLSLDEHYVYEALYEFIHKKSGKTKQYEAIKFFDDKLNKKYCKSWRDKFDYILGDDSPRVGYQPENFKEGELELFHDLAEEYKALSESERRDKLKKEWFTNKTIRKKTITDSKNYVIILDEINRCNVSKVFGELITLIEDDKREHIKTTLPSGEPFTVPKNLYIIGTMNTADKSISMVDIALRRRFEFIPLYPDPDIIKDEDKKQFMTDINKVIKDKKSIDFQIGHADFMKDLTLEDTINRKTLPLLMEYFRNNVEDVEKMLSSCLPDSLIIDAEWKDHSGLLKIKQNS